VTALTFFSSTVFGILIEIRQYFLPYRKAEIGDVIADALGAVAGILICFVWTRKK
jgi:VanZ family protein